MNDNLPTPPLQQTERDKYNFDVGYEHGWGERNAHLLDAFETALETAISSLRSLIAEMAAE